jgi:hypothetical protein
MIHRVNRPRYYHIAFRIIAPYTCRQSLVTALAAEDLQSLSLSISLPLIQTLLVISTWIRSAYQKRFVADDRRCYGIQQTI